MSNSSHIVEYVDIARVRVKPDGPWIYMETHEVEGWMNSPLTPSGHYEVEGVQMTRAEYETWNLEG
jgi:hypothetical protein